MLSKSQAKLFFWTFTIGFSGVFLWLTVDTIRVIPVQSNEHLLTKSVVRGKVIWEENNCMGCHTLLGEGAYYAPELTKVVDRRGKDWIRTFIKDPEKMYPGRRKMIKYDFTEDQITDVIEFLDWIGKIDTNGFPPEPDLAPKKVARAPVKKGQKSALASAPKSFKASCQGCHAVEGKGGNVGPALDGMGSRKDQKWIRAWLKDPQKIKPKTTMPNLGLKDADLDALSAWLFKLK